MRRRRKAEDKNETLLLREFGLLHSSASPRELTFADLMYAF